MSALRLVRTARGHPSVRVEKMFRLKGLPCRASGVIDLAAQTRLAPGIVDWKIGARSVGEDDSLQLNVYAMWDSAEFRRAPEAVRIFKAFLGSSEVVRYRCTEATVDRAQRRIAQDAIRSFAVNITLQRFRCLTTNHQSLSRPDILFLRYVSRKSRTHDHSSLAVVSGDLVSTHFQVPATQERGPSQLVVAANGIPSAPAGVTVR
jgi:hypothetical protein